MEIVLIYIPTCQFTKPVRQFTIPTCQFTMPLRQFTTPTCEFTMSARHFATRTCQSTMPIRQNDICQFFANPIVSYKIIRFANSLPILCQFFANSLPILPFYHLIDAKVPCRPSSADLLQDPTALT